MIVPIFKNEKPYSVAVPTPYGSSINVKTGYYISGNYFNAFYRVNKELRLMPEGTKVPDNLLTCSYSVTPKVSPSTVVVSSRPVVDYANSQVPEPERVAAHIAEPVKNKGGRPKKTIQDATQDMWNDVNYVLPPASDVHKLTTEALTKLAIKLDVSKNLPRQEMIESIKLRLG
jgi:hypothetical protein